MLFDSGQSGHGVTAQESTNEVKYDLGEVIVYKERRGRKESSDLKCRAS